MNELAAIVNQSKIEESEKGIIIDKFGNFEQVANEWQEKAKTLVVTDRSQLTEMEMAKIAAKKFADMRIEVERIRKEMKEQSLRKGQAIDAIAKYLQSLITPVEDHYKKQANFIKLEDERIAKEKADAEAKAEFERLENERIAKEKAIEEEQKKIREENEKLRAEAQARELEMKKQREEAEKKQAEIEAKARAEAQAREKAEAELEAQKDAEKKRKIEEEEKVKKLLEEAESIRKNRLYQDWIKDNNYDANTMTVERNGNTFILWKKVSVLTIE